MNININRTKLMKSKGLNCVPSLSKETQVKAENHNRVAKAIVELMKEGKQNDE